MDITRAFNSNLDFFTGFATIIFSFANHQGALPVERSLHTTDEKIMNKVFLISIIFDIHNDALHHIISFQQET